MNPAKIRLSQTEMELVTNADLILTKNALLKKVHLLLGNLQEKQHEVVRKQTQRLPEKASGTYPKISKGENYKGLPYLILDYPRYFDHENIFAIRTMFWWGNFFSVTLHLSGEPKKEAKENLIASYHTLSEKGYYCYLNEDQWEHHFESENYRLVSAMNKNDFERTVRENSFIKIANKISLAEWDVAEEMLLGNFKELIGILAV